MTQELLNELASLDTKEIRRELRAMRETKELLDELAARMRPMYGADRFLNDREAAKWLRVSQRTLQDYRTRNLIPYFKLPGKVLYRESDLVALLENHYNVARSEERRSA